MNECMACGRAFLIKDKCPICDGLGPWTTLGNFHAENKARRIIAKRRSESQPNQKIDGISSSIKR
jgi:hypothetical protein